MSNQKNRGKNAKRSKAKTVAGGAVGTIFNIVLFVVAAMLVYRFSVSAYHYGIRIFGEPAMSEAPGTEVTVTIEDGMDFEQIAEVMYENGLVRDKKLFLLQEKLSNYSKDGFAEGTFTLTTAMTPEEIMDHLAGEGAAE